MKLSKVSTKYGSPMGRQGYGTDFAGRLYVGRVPIDAGGYDPGGAYWGIGMPIYAASDTPVGDTVTSTAFATLRANNRAEAIQYFKGIFPNATFHKP